MVAKKPTPLASALAGALTGATAPAKVQMPKAIAELRVGPAEDDVIPAGAVITDELADAAGLNAAAIDRLELLGHVQFVEVYATPAAAPSGDGRA